MHVRTNDQVGNSDRRIPLRLVVSGVAAALLLAATVLTGLYLGLETQDRFQQIDNSWRSYSAEADRRGELLSRVRGYLGYGGIIHDFKNYVLRQDPFYLERLKSRFADFKATIAEYRDANPSPTELEHLSAIEATFEEYRAKLEIAIQAAEEKWDRVRTDKLVKVDDADAIRALSALDAFWRDKRRQSTKAIAQSVDEGQALVTTGFRFLAGLLVVALVLFALFYALQRELRQTIHLLSKELAERKSAEHMATKFLRAAEQSPSTIIITDTEGRIEFVNRRFMELTGYAAEEVIGQTPRLLQSGESSRDVYSDLRKKLAAGEEWRGNFRNSRKDGTSYWVHTAIFPLRNDAGEVTHYIGVGEDLTERRRARDQLRRAQKIEAVGVLASGVAHDFNNILTTILGNAHLALVHAPSDAVTRQEIEQIEIAAKRGRNLVGQLLTFARRQPGEPITILIKDIIDEVSRLMRASIQKTTVITTDIADETLTTFADPTRLHQVFMNLCTNAAEAIGADAGTISIRAQAAESAVGKKDLVRITVDDTGPGISPEHLQTIFEPFFTTKSAGKGTGLGLSVVKELVAEMKGTISVSSQPGHGTRFDLMLPRSHPAQCVSDEAPTILGGRGRILLVDDEPGVVDTCRKLLIHFGYEVDAFTDPIAAVSAFETEPDLYDMVMTDFVMPEMNGQEVAQAVRAASPTCPILICTAYQPATLDLEVLGPIRLIEKPVDPVKLDHNVRNLITAPHI